MSGRKILGLIWHSFSRVNGLSLSVIICLMSIGLQFLVSSTNIRAGEKPLDQFECNFDQLWYEMDPEGSLADIQSCADGKPCSDPFLRNLWSVNSTPPITYIRIMFHVIREDDGSNPAATMGLVDSQMVQLNEDFLPSRLQFIYKARFVDSSLYRTWNQFSFFDLTPMKADLFIDPHLQLNIIVTKLLPGPSGASNPDLFDPYGINGGIVMSTNNVGTQFHSDMRRHTMTHEVGHIFGLGHPSVGIDAFPCVHSCAEHLGTGSNNFNGDQMEDTPPQPGWGGSTFAGAGIDACSGLPWPAIANNNYMNFANTSKTTFTPQQFAMMRCYLEDQMSNWVAGVTFGSQDPLFGSDSLEVTFSSESDITPNQWRWSFGDGDSAFVSDPTHMFGPGYHTVTAEIDTDSGIFAYQHADYVAVHSDSLISGDATGLGGESARVDVYARNYIPVTSMWIPFIWDGPLNISFDSGTVAGLRTESANANLVSIDPFAKRALYIVDAGANNVIDPGAGPILSLYFTLPSGAEVSSAPILIQDWGANVRRFNTKFGSYAPTGLSGTVTRACCANAGDVDNSGSINISDVTFLISRIFAGRAAPRCCAAADANGNGAVNIADVTFLIARIFAGGPAPVCGPVDVGC